MSPHADIADNLEVQEMTRPSKRGSSPRSKLTFEQALDGAVSGRSESYEWLYYAYAGRIRAFARTRSFDEADSVTNDVMLRAFQRLGSFTGDEKAFVRWLYTIARNRLIDGHRQAQRRPDVLDGVVPDGLVESAEAGAMRKLSGEDIHEYLAVLTVDQREVIALRLVEDLSLADVAEIVDRPVTAVKALQRRGLSALRRHMTTESNS